MFLYFHVQLQAYKTLNTNAVPPPSAISSPNRRQLHVVSSTNSPERRELNNTTTTIPVQQSTDPVQLNASPLNQSATTLLNHTSSNYNRRFSTGSQRRRGSLVAKLRSTISDVFQSTSSKSSRTTTPTNATNNNSTNTWYWPWSLIGCGSWSDEATTQAKYSALVSAGSGGYTTTTPPPAATTKRCTCHIGDDIVWTSELSYYQLPATEPVWAPTTCGYPTTLAIR